MKKYIVAVDLGGTNIKAAVIRDGKKIIDKIMVSTKAYKNRDALINGIAQLCRKLIEKNAIKKGEILGIGIGLPGLIDSKRGIVHHLVNIEGFKNVPLKKLIEKKTDIRTFLDNDVNVMTLGELHYGAGQGAKNMLCITLGTGVGGGIIINGSLYRGSSLSAGEIGHMPLNEIGPKCGCGGFGCMEKFVGNKYIVETAAKKIRAGKKTLIKKLVKGNLKRLTPEIISRAAKRNDALAKAIWKEVGAHLGVTLAGVINLINPERIVIGGGVSEAGKFLFESIKRTVKERAMRVPANCAKIVKAKLGQDAGLIGAAVLVRLGK